MVRASGPGLLLRLVGDRNDSMQSLLREEAQLEL